MNLGLSWATKNRGFEKAMRFVYQEFAPLLDSFERIEVINPTCYAILLGITDEKPETYFRKIHNKQGFFQVFAGCPATSDDNILKRAVFERLLKTVRACPLNPQDRAAYEALFEDWRQQHLS